MQIFRPISQFNSVIVLSARSPSCFRYCCRPNLRCKEDCLSPRRRYAVHGPRASPAAHSTVPDWQRWRIGPSPCCRSGAGKDIAATPIRYGGDCHLPTHRHKCTRLNYSSACSITRLSAWAGCHWSVPSGSHRRDTKIFGKSAAATNEPQCSTPQQRLAIDAGIPF